MKIVTLAMVAMKIDTRVSVPITADRKSRRLLKIEKKILR